jgi:hypothetical protein
MRFRQAGRRHDAGATDPILVIAAIAVSLVLLVGGTFAVSGMLSNAKDLNAKGDLDKIATSEAAVASGGGDGTAGGNAYLSWAVAADGTITGDTDSSGKYLHQAAVGFTPTTGVTEKVAVNKTAWVAGVLSATGAKFYRSSQSSRIYQETIPTGAYDPSLTVPRLTPPYNAAAECTSNGSNVASLTDRTAGTFQSVRMTKTDESNVRVTAVTDGRTLCPWATTLPLNLAGDTKRAADNSGGYLSVYYTYNSGGTQVVTSGPTGPTGAGVTLTSTDDAIAAQRTVSFDFTITYRNGFANTDAYVSAWNTNGGFAQYSFNGQTIVLEHVGALHS